MVNIADESNDKVLGIAKDKMEKAVSVLQKELQGLRTDRTTPAFLDPVIVEANGSKMKIAQIANVSLIKTQTLKVQPWDTKLIKAIEKAIISANLGVNPVVEGESISISMPPLSHERRNEIIKIAHKYGEAAKIAIRNVRRDSLDKIKSSTASKDDIKTLTQKLQKFTDDFTSSVDVQVSKKEKEVAG
jgi:ribosome recycling factor